MELAESKRRCWPCQFCWHFATTDSRRTLRFPIALDGPAGACMPLQHAAHPLGKLPSDRTAISLSFHASLICWPIRQESLSAGPWRATSAGCSCMNAGASNAVVLATPASAGFSFQPNQSFSSCNSLCRGQLLGQRGVQCISHAGGESSMMFSCCALEGGCCFLCGATPPVHLLQPLHAHLFWSVVS